MLNSVLSKRIFPEIILEAMFCTAHDRKANHKKHIPAANVSDR